MSDIIIEMFPVSYGESFLLTFEGVKRRHILVDGGRISTYDVLKRRLLELKSQGEKISLLIITHIDSDHIGGIVKLLEENESAEKANIIKIDEIWYNCYANSQFIKKYATDLSAEEEQIIKNCYLNGYKEDTNVLQSKNNPVGIVDATSVANLIISGKYNWNTITQGAPICVENISQFKLDNECDIKFNIVSPNQENLDNLDGTWLKELQMRKKDFKMTHDSMLNAAYDYFMSRIDDVTITNINQKMSIADNDIEKLANIDYREDISEVNASSIAFVVEYKNYKLLFLGDCLSSVLLKNLQNIYPNNKKYKFNGMKISHHGSKFNTTKELLQKIECDNILISTDGSGGYNHPDKETLSKLLVYLNCEGVKKIYLNSENKSLVNKKFIEHLRNDILLKEKYKYSLEIVKNNKIHI